MRSLSFLLILTALPHVVGAQVVSGRPCATSSPVAVEGKPGSQRDLPSLLDELPPSLKAAPCESPEDEVADSSRLEHLLAAARHLEAAGLSSQAAGVRRLADEERRLHAASLLDRKTEQLRHLQAQIEQLRRLCAPSTPLEFQVKIVEISPVEIRHTGADVGDEEDGSLVQAVLAAPLGRLEEGIGRVPGAAFRVVEQGDCSLGILKTYEMMKLARNRTAARLMTLSGQVATVEVHGTSKRPIRIQLLPTALGEDKLHLQVAVETDGAGTSPDRQAGGGEASPSTSTIDLEVDIEPGQTLLIGQPAANAAIPSSLREDSVPGGAAHHSSGDRETETVILITPVLAGGDGSPATAAGRESHRRR